MPELLPCAPDWEPCLQEVRPILAQLALFLEQERLHHEVYPPPELIGAALQRCPLAQVRAVILGQDPYHGKGQAQGLAFSVPAHQPIPPSLRNIFLEIHADLGGFLPQDGDLTHWADQGVLLLNTTLSVRRDEPASHAGQGWEEVTDAILRSVIHRPGPPIAFLLWGKHAAAKKSLFRPDSPHLVLEAAHPSPLSAYRGFFGCRHFSLVNEFLRRHDLAPIRWFPSHA